jgi:transcriptional regulator with XRE-family HTH domain
MKRYVYLLKCPVENIVRYVGQTYSVEIRYRQHLTCKSTNIYKNNWIKNLKAQGLKPIIEIVCEGDFDYINQQEKIIIAHYRDLVGKKLVNMREGGDEEIPTEEALQSQRQGILDAVSPFKTLEDVIALYTEILSGKPINQIASEKNCSRDNIGHIVRGITHKYFSSQIKTLQQDTIVYCRLNRLSIGGTGGASFVPKPHLNDEFIYQIFDLYVNKDMTIYEIGEEIQATPAHVYNILAGKFRKNLLSQWIHEGNEPPKLEREYESRWSEKELLKAFDYRKEGLKTEQIADKLGCNRDYLNSIFRGARLPHIKKQWESLNGEYVPPKSHNLHICANPACGKEFFEYHDAKYCSKACFGKATKTSDAYDKKCSICSTTESKKFLKSDGIILCYNCYRRKEREKKKLTRLA